MILISKSHPYAELFGRSPKMLIVNYERESRCSDIFDKG